MRLIGLAVALSVSFILAALAVEAQRAGKVMASRGDHVFYGLIAA
jgi:hypothetical protein